MRNGCTPGLAQRFHFHGHSAGMGDDLQDGPGPCWEPGIRVFESKSAWGQPQSISGGMRSSWYPELCKPLNLAQPLTSQTDSMTMVGEALEGLGLRVHPDEFASSVAPTHRLRRVGTVSPPPEGPSGEEAGGAA